MEASWGFPRPLGGSFFQPPPTMVSACFPTHKVIQISRRSRSYGRLNSNFTVQDRASEWLEPLHIATGGRWTKKCYLYIQFGILYFFLHLFFLYFPYFFSLFSRIQTTEKWFLRYNRLSILEFCVAVFISLFYVLLGCYLVVQHTWTKKKREIQTTFFSGSSFDFFIPLFQYNSWINLSGFYHRYQFHQLSWVHISPWFSIHFSSLSTSTDQLLRHCIKSALKYQ